MKRARMKMLPLAMTLADEAYEKLLVRLHAFNDEEKAVVWHEIGHKFGGLGEDYKDWPGEFDAAGFAYDALVSAFNVDHPFDDDLHGRVDAALDAQASRACFYLDDCLDILSELSGRFVGVKDPQSVGFLSQDWRTCVRTHARLVARAAITEAAADKLEAISEQAEKLAQAASKFRPKKVAVAELTVEPAQSPGETGKILQAQDGPLHSVGVLVEGFWVRVSWEELPPLVAG